jgi:hypothetical protein
MFPLFLQCVHPTVADFMSSTTITNASITSVAFHLTCTLWLVFKCRFVRYGSCVPLNASNLLLDFRFGKVSFPEDKVKESTVKTENHTCSFSWYDVSLLLRFSWHEITWVHFSTCAIFMKIHEWIRRAPGASSLQRRCGVPQYLYRNRITVHIQRSHSRNMFLIWCGFRHWKKDCCSHLKWNWEA